VFLIKDQIHMQGRGCSKCFGNDKKTIENFIKNQMMFIITNMTIHW